MAAAPVLASETPQAFQKAELAVDGGDPIRCLLNPTEYTITKTNTWTFKPVTGSSLPKGEFGGGNPRELAVSLLLDVSLLGPGQSVRGVTDDLFRMMEVASGQTAGGAKAVPPFLTFRWGAVETFKAVCTSLTVAFGLFHPNGEPIRADVKLQLKQVEPAADASGTGTDKGQNPTTRAVPGLGVHTVHDGDSLASIAHAAYGDPNHWRAVAEANGIDDPLRLRRGTALMLPRIER
jgi:hypothetical protein